MSMEPPSPDAGMYVGGVDDFAEASSSNEQFELLRRRLHGLTGETRFEQEEDTRLETTRMRLSNVLKRFKNLGDRVTRDSDRLIYERLQKEFDVARAAQTEEILLKGDEWNDGLLATIRDRVHMEADRKAMSSHTSMPSDPHTNARITYRVGNKVICCLEGARIGIQYETAFAGEPCEMYHCVLESKSFLEKMSVIEHTLPFFLPIREAEANFLSSNAMEFIEYIGTLIQSFVDRREQTTRASNFHLLILIYGDNANGQTSKLSGNLMGVPAVVALLECGNLLGNGSGSSQLHGKIDIVTTLVHG